MASDQAEQKLETFFHHDKAEHPPTDTEVGKKPARDSGTRQEEHKQKRREEAGPIATQPLMQPKDRRVKEAVHQADQYGRKPNVALTFPQTLIEEQNPFGLAEAKEPAEKTSLFTPLAEKA